MNVRHILIRMIEQPTIFREFLAGILPRHRKSYLIAERYVGKLNMLIDVGANCGEVIKAFRFSNPEINAIAFEPLEEHKSTLEKFGNIKVFTCGLWDDDTAKTFYATKERSGVSSSFFMPDDFKPEKRKINLKRFDSLGLKIRKPCFLKIDAEGAEDRILKGFGNILKDVGVIQIEIKHFNNLSNSCQAKDIFKITDKYGFINFKQINPTFEDKKQKILGKTDIIFWK